MIQIGVKSPSRPARHRRRLVSEHVVQFLRRQVTGPKPVQVHLGKPGFKGRMHDFPKFIVTHGLGSPARASDVPKAVDARSGVTADL
ncbi:MAG: hypothetical protein ACK4VZ_05860 [Paracoccaceae bacterium]